MAKSQTPKNDIHVFEVGPRDGIQNESRTVTFEDKLFLVSGLVHAGVADMELGAFVREDKVPQMADTGRIFEAIQAGDLDLKRCRAWSLVPNLKGLERAISAGAKHVAVFTAATDSFTLKNIGMSVAESLKEFSQVIRESKANGIEVRGYVSTAFGCPFEGKVAPKKALKVIERLAEMGVAQVSIGDTIGVATPMGVEELLRPALEAFETERIAVHFHDTRGTALANTLRAIDLGVRTVDSSAGGLGGCPFAPGATGNLATEDLVFMLDGMRLRSGIDLNALAKVSLEFSRRIGRPLASRYLQAYAATCP